MQCPGTLSVLGRRGVVGHPVWQTLPHVLPLLPQTLHPGVGAQPPLPGSLPLPACIREAQVLPHHALPPWGSNVPINSTQCGCFLLFPPGGMSWGIQTRTSAPVGRELKQVDLRNLEIPEDAQGGPVS